MYGLRLIFVVIATTFLCFEISGAVFAQSLRTEHTYQLDDSESRPMASLADVSWLVGSWSGEAFGSNFEEVWNPASAGSMVGMWKLLKDDQVVFYELMLLVEEEGSLSIKVKHFSEDFTAWEDKEEFIRFQLVKIAADEVHFAGLSFYRIDENEIHAYIVMTHDGEVREEKMTYIRND